MTFVPCFLFVFLGAPYVETLRRHRAVHAALGAVTAAVVGVVLNLSVWFALHVLFGSLHAIALGSLRIDVPTWSTWHPFAMAIAATAMLAMLRFHVGLGKTLAACAMLGLATWWLGVA